MTVDEFLAVWHDGSDRLLVHTSGSTGKPKPMLVEKRRMENSARLTCQFLGLKPGDTALLCLPLDYIAGKMMVVRALTCGLRLISTEPSGHPLSGTMRPMGSMSPITSTIIDFAAMVPLQVYNSLQVPTERERLMQIRHLIIGGGAIDDALASELRLFPNAVWSTYGMTETLSHIALRSLSGPEATEWYTPLQGVGVSLTADGCLIVDAPHVCPEPLVTNDMALLRDDSPTSAFRILGRKDNVICSGGVKIMAEEVERLLRPYMRVPYIITKAPDNKYGEQVVLLAEGLSDASALLSVCRQVLPKYSVPRRVVNVDRLPLTATGKPARKEAERLVALAVEV